MRTTNSEKPWYRKVKDTWYCWHNGKQVSLGVKGKSNRKEAVEAFFRLMANRTQNAEQPRTGDAEVRCSVVREPAEPSSNPTPVKPQQATVQQVVDAFLADIQERAKPKTHEVYAYLLKSLTTEYGTRTADSMKPHEVETSARKPEWGSSTKNDYLGSVISAFRWAVRAGVIPANPLEGVRKPPKASRGAKSVISKADFKELCSAASPAFKLFLTGLWLTGCRPGELSRLKVEDVDLENCVAVLHEHKTAHTDGKPRSIYLSADAVKLFRSQAKKHKTGLLFRNNEGNEWNEDAITGAMTKTKKRAGVPHATAYGFRHSFATEALANGVPDATVATLLGHRTTNMLHKHYSHLTSRTDVLRAAVAKVR